MSAQMQEGVVRKGVNRDSNGICQSEPEHLDICTVDAISKSCGYRRGLRGSFTIQNLDFLAKNYH